MENTTLILLLSVIALLAGLAVQGYRMKLLMKIGLRNISRRKVNTCIVVLGLMVGTSIISGSMVMGDTLENMYTKQIYDEYHETDEGIFTFGSGGNLGFFNETEYDELDSYVEQDPVLSKKVEDVSPEIIYQLSVFDAETLLSEPDVTLIGFDYGRSDAFGRFSPRSSGGTLTEEDLSGDEVYVNSRLANEIDVKAGHRLRLLFGENRSGEFTVKAVVEDEGRAAYVHPGTHGYNMFMSLEQAQALLGQEGHINVLRITNTGDNRDGMRHSDAVEKALGPYLENNDPFLLLAKMKQDDVKAAEENSEETREMFIILGSFSVIAGMMLIVNIFVMLAEERRGEMGMSRALGMTRNHLAQVFMFEGAGYAIISAVVGTFLGIVAAYGFLGAFDSVSFDEDGVDRSMTYEPLEFFTFTVDSLVLSFTVGIIITFLTIAFASWKASKLNIIRAIRNLPEPRYKRHNEVDADNTYSTSTGPGLFLFNTVLRQYEVIFMVLSGSLLFASLVDIGMFYHELWAAYCGLCCFIYATGLLLRRYIPDEKAFILSGGLVLLIWCYPYDIFDRLFNVTMTGEEVDKALLAGIFMVSSALLVTMSGSNYMLGLLMKIFGRFRSLAPVLRIAISYPLSNRFRTGMTLAMFALILFTVTTLAMVVGLIEGDIDNTTRNASGGYHMVADVNPESPLEDIDFLIEENENLFSADYSAIVPMNTAYVMMHPVYRNEDSTEQRIQSQMDMPFPEYRDQERTLWYNLLGCSDEFFRESDFPLQGWNRDEYDNSRDVWNAVKTNPSLVIVDEEMMKEPGEEDEEEGSEFEVEAGDFLVVRDMKGNFRAVEVVGFTRSEFFPGIFVRSDVVSGSGEGSFGVESASMFLFRFSEDVPEDRYKGISKDMEREFLASGMETVIIKEEVMAEQRGLSDFLTLMQTFLSLGLGVGVAGLGIITVRSVSERTQQIGMLRSIGFTRSMIMRSFLIESSYVGLLGILIGTGLGILMGLRFFLDKNFGPDGGFGGDFTIPWENIMIIGMISYVLTFLTTVGPARAAAATSPADALRYVG